MTSEPDALKRGKQFHAVVQRQWAATAEGKVAIEVTIPLIPADTRLQRAKRGRMDVFVDEVGEFVVVVEIKATDWDRISPQNRQRNLASHRRQVWRYIGKHLDGDGRSVCAGIIYPSAPKDAGLQRRIEEYLGDYGLQVVWHDG